jgi:putative membrane protein
LSNADALIGRIGVVIADIPAGASGYVKVDGDEWRAVSQNGMAITSGNKVEIVSRESIIITVKLI